ncbi:MAG: hypothetical protein P4L83_14810 [Nevskia sp.]|nr:hypothetical protein [Nevskia sp.]
MRPNTVAKFAATLLLPLALAPAFAADSTVELAKARKCFSCHKTSTPSYGPSFQQIARRYHGMANADTMLADEIKTGTDPHWIVNKHWGTTDMPPSVLRAPVTDEEAKQLATWVLSHNK